LTRRPPLLALAAVAALPVPAAAPARADTALQVGMTIQGDGELCTAGFFGRNATGGQFIVTAGHCSRAVGEMIYDIGGATVGEVVARVPDGRTSYGPFGYTLIWLAGGTYIGADYFASVGNANVGDTVHVYGARTGLTSGAVTAAATSPVDPAASVVESSARVARGDSGGPWYEDGPILVGICIGYDVAVPGGGFLFSYGMPIDPLLRLIRQTAGDWGNSLQVITG
jgi:hypothetical protein